MWSQGLPPFWYRDLGFGGVMKSRAGRGKPEAGEGLHSAREITQ